MVLYLWLTIFFFLISLQYSHSQMDFSQCHLSSSTEPPTSLSSIYVPPSSSPTATVMFKLSEPTNNFGLRFFEQLNSEHDDNNVLFSPLSVILSCGMLLEGATGQTEQQIKEVLELSSFGDTSEVASAAKELLTSYKLIENDSSDRNFSLAIGNLAMVNKRVKIKESFVQSLLTNYFAQATNEDFDNGIAVTNKLNSWILDKTFGKISSALDTPPGWRTTLILVNTVYFKGKWAAPFPKANTHDGTFTNSDGTRSNVKMMSIYYERFNYVHNREKKLKIIELPYHRNVSMIFIAPTVNNTLSSLVSTLNSSELNDLLSSMKQTELNINIPKFKLEDTHKLHHILPSMGMDLPFSHLAELSNIADKAAWNVSESIQKALIEVDEEGTRAASVTSIVTPAAYFPPEDFALDRPFIFMIRDNLTRVNLFMGQMNKMANIETPESSSNAAPTTTEPTTITPKRSLISRMIQPQPVSKQQSQQMMMNASD